MFKKMNGIWALVLISTAASANTGRTVLSINIGNGTVAPGFQHWGLLIRADGDVIGSRAGTTKLLGNLSRDVMEKIITLAEKAKGGKLIDENPSSPMCMDAPIKTYEVVREDGRAITFKQRAGCHDFNLMNASEYNYVFSNLLDGLSSLNSLQ